MNKKFRVNDLVKYDYSEIGEYIDENHTDKPLRNDEVCDLLNFQDEKIKVLQNSWEIMNQRLSEKSKCDYKEAIIEFCKFMNIDTPLLEVMVDEFLQEVF